MGISIIIPCYNYESLIIEKYNKLKKKADNIKENIEIIFIDDGSTDNTYKKLKIFLQEKCRGASVERN